MTALPSARTLDDLTMPGTHNTCALIGGPFDTAKCQSLTLPEQLARGVRYLDIRCRPFDGAFTIHHGAIYQRRNFHDVLTDCRAFLTANPGETILMSVQKEHSDAPAAEFARIFHDVYLRDHEFERWFHRAPGRIPTLGEVRGRIVLVAKAPGIGGLDRYDGNLLSVQDEWTLPTARKWDAFQHHLDTSA
ncbi:phosphatidylinositol-specific phospholipase C, partial [Streptomyces alkaliterrae]